MRLSKKTLLIYLAILTCSLPVFGQQASKGYSLFTYHVSVPVGNTQDYISHTSWRGIGFEMGSFLGEKISVGLASSWNVFYKDMGESTIITDNNTIISGKQYRHINSLPIFAVGRYYFKLITTDAVLPYTSLGVGTIYQNQKTSMGLYSSQEYGWLFALAPEIGIAYRLAYGVGLSLSAKYNHGFENNNAPGISYFSFNGSVVLAF